MTQVLADVLATIATRGIQLRVDDAGELAVRGPIDAVLVAALRAHRDAVIAAVRERELRDLQTTPCANCGKFAFPVRGVVCFWCKQAVGTRSAAKSDTTTTERT